ncbi:MAG: hypothetical protein ACTSXW_04130, partial [Candidatus Baldrarchaeia archaeon]
MRGKKFRVKRRPRTIYMPDYLWMRLSHLADKLGVSVSKLVVHFCIRGLKEKVPEREYESLQRMQQIEENIEKMAKLTRWGNELRKSGAYAEKTLNELLQGISPDTKIKIPLPNLCSEEELEAIKRLFQHRNALARETAKLILEEFPDLKTFNIGVDHRGRWKVYTKEEITPDTIATALINMIDADSDVSFTDWVKAQKQKMFYDFSNFDGVAEFFELVSKNKEEK